MEIAVPQLSPEQPAMQTGSSEVALDTKSISKRSLISNHATVK